MKEQEPIQQLTEIRNLMERSSRFMSLSGLSGVVAGIIALVGVGIAFICHNPDLNSSKMGWYHSGAEYFNNRYDSLFLVTDAIIILVLALFSGIYFTTRKARKQGLKIWDNTARRMVINLSIPLVAGGIFCLILWYHQLVFLLAPVTLLFYGLALINAGKYTYDEIRVLGLIEIILGLMASWLAGYGLLFWAVGFGAMHIVYGLVMYFRYEGSRKSEVGSRE